jgi:hypothetical protein
LEAVFVLLEFPSPSKIIFIDSYSPLSGSPYSSFTWEQREPGTRLRVVLADVGVAGRVNLRCETRVGRSALHN